MIISTNILLIIFTLILSFMIFLSHLELSYYGITLENWKSDLKTSALYTTLFLMAVLAIKFIFIKSSQQTHIQLLELSIRNKLPLHSTMEFIFYFLFTILQEFTTRGVIQGVIMELADTRWQRIRGILLVTLIFSCSHLHFPSKQLALFTYIS